MPTFETSEVSHDEMVALTEMWDAIWYADMLREVNEHCDEISQAEYPPKPEFEWGDDGFLYYVQ